jgi:hypothetical protein
MSPWGDSIPGRNRWQLRGGRDGSARLPAQVLPWQMEIYLSILDSMLVSLPAPVVLPEASSQSWPRRCFATSCQYSCALDGCRQQDAAP